MNDPTQRFSNRVDNYVKYRPGYPPEVLDAVAAECGFTREATVADIGAGTGIFSRVLLDHGNRVFAVEPNAEMRVAAEQSLHGYSRFTSVTGTAEATTLPPASVPFITVAQALHWFRPTPTRAEFARILQPGGWVIVLWNERHVDTNPFLRAYEELLLTFGTDYKEVRHANLDPARVRGFFDSDAVKFTVLPNRQVFDYEALRGRLLSSSYAPDESHPNHLPMLARLEEIFRRHEADGTVAFDYDLHLYTGQLS